MLCENILFNGNRRPSIIRTLDSLMSCQLIFKEKWLFMRQGPYLVASRDCFMINFEPLVFQDTSTGFELSVGAWKPTRPSFLLVPLCWPPRLRSLKWATNPMAVPTIGTKWPPKWKQKNYSRTTTPQTTPTKAPAAVIKRPPEERDEALPKLWATTSLWVRLAKALILGHWHLVVIDPQGACNPDIAIRH